MEWWKKGPINAVLLDISGVLRDGDEVVPGSIQALGRLQSSGIPLRLVTNESQIPSSGSLKKLLNLGYRNITVDKIFSPAPAIKKIIQERKLRPFFLVHDELIDFFKDIPQDNPNCIVVGDAAEGFNYTAINKAFQLLVKLKESKGGTGEEFFFSMGIGMYYKDNDELHLDLGFFTKALENCTQLKARVIGKPNPEYFEIALNDLGTKASETIMIGDDVVGDVGGAQGSGMRGILVRTGKFRPSDASHPLVKPDGIVNDLSEAVDLILKNHAEASSQ